MSMLTWPAKQVNRILLLCRVLSVEEINISLSQKSLAYSWLIWSIGSWIVTGFSPSLVAGYCS
jgi:hypothetical protein